MSKPRRPRRSCGAAGTASQTEILAIVMEEVHSPMESTRKFESYVFDNFLSQSETQMRRRARLMEPAGVSRFCKESVAAFSMNTFMAE